MHATFEVARHSQNVSLIDTDADHPSIILCGVDDEFELKKCLDKIRNSGFICKPFHESDLGGELTAFATEPVLEEGRRHFKKLQLLKQKDMVSLEVGVA